jgi:hypothetical protein
MHIAHSAVRGNFSSRNFVLGGELRDANVVCLVDWQLGTTMKDGLLGAEKHHPSRKSDLEGFGWHFF